MDLYVAKYEKASKCINPRDLYLDRPSRTVTCRNLAGATGDMHRIRLPNGSRRRITIREAARLQSFPDWFDFIGTETRVFTQIGNAVPPMLAYALANSTRDYLNSKKMIIQLATTLPSHEMLANCHITFSDRTFSDSSIPRENNGSSWMDNC